MQALRQFALHQVECHLVPIGQLTMFYLTGIPLTLNSVTQCFRNNMRIFKVRNAVYSF